MVISQYPLPIYSEFCISEPATTEIYTLSLHDALPISGRGRRRALAALAPAAPGAVGRSAVDGGGRERRRPHRAAADRKSTRLNSSHANISYAVFCLKNK